MLPFFAPPPMRCARRAAASSVFSRASVAATMARELPAIVAGLFSSSVVGVGILRDLGFAVQIQPAESSIPALVEAICAFYTEP